MKHSRVEGRPVTVLSGLPRPVRIGLVAVIALVVGFGGLSQAGLLAPQFRSSGGGSGSAEGGPKWAWATLENVSWREWQVTAVDVTYEGGGSVDIAAFVPPAGTSASTLADQFSAHVRTPTRTRAPALTRLPLRVQPGRDLVVFGSRDPRPCVRLVFPDRQPRPTQIAVRIDTPLGQRTIRTPLFIEPCRA